MVFTFINWVNSTSLWVHLLSFRLYMVPDVKWYMVKSLVENVKCFNTFLKSGKLPSLNTPVLTFHSNHPRWKLHKPQSIYSCEWNKVGWGCLGPTGISMLRYDSKLVSPLRAFLVLVFIWYFQKIWVSLTLGNQVFLQNDCRHKTRSVLLTSKGCSS